MGDKMDRVGGGSQPTSKRTSQAEFERRPSLFQLERLKSQVEEHAWSGPQLDVIYAGVAVQFKDESETSIAFAIRDSTYLVDYGENKFSAADLDPSGPSVAEFIVQRVTTYRDEHVEKFRGLAFDLRLAERCPSLGPRLWAELDILPIILHQEETHSWSLHEKGTVKTLDEQAESFARKCLRFFGPGNEPILQVGIQGLVEVDVAFHAKLTRLSDYEKTVGEGTWSSTMKYAADLKDRNIKIAFFSATPQGGGVALMRHAFLRFARELGIDMKWYVPKPKPGVFRITKNNHNILQGVADPELRFNAENRDIVHDWIKHNADRYWLRKGGPLSSPAEGGADVIVIDDPQMPHLIPLIKQVTPNRPIIFRSHIQIRSDLIALPGTPQAESWAYLWEDIQHADLFISHPVRAFVPVNVPSEIVGYLPASTDWLDGLNKHMSEWDIAYYGRIFNARCREQAVTCIEFPSEEYIVQIARFDPSKGIIDVLRSYSAFHDRLTQTHPEMKPPKLLICGHGSVDDPDGSTVYDSVVGYTEAYLPHLKHLISIMRLGPSDQLLNALLSKAKIALQLSTREGFEVKVSEALHKGKPVIATLAGGIPLQVQHQKNGFLVNIGDIRAVARHLFDLWTDPALYERMSTYAATSVSDEVTTVGNTMSWLYLASKMSKGEPVRPDGGWINDLAREEAGEPYGPQENRLKRALQTAEAK